MKPIDEFTKRGEGYRNECKQCHNKTYKPKKKEREDDKEYKCNTCKEMKRGINIAVNVLGFR